MLLEMKIFTNIDLKIKNTSITIFYTTRSRNDFQKKSIRRPKN